MNLKMNDDDDNNKLGLFIENILEWIEAKINYINISLLATLPSSTETEKYNY